MKKLLNGIVVACMLAVATPALALDMSKPYKPLFEVKLRAKTGIVADYMNAYRSLSIGAAIQNWQAFSKRYSASENIESLTSLVLIRQAAYELARLYYLNDQVKEGDAQMIHATEITAYQVKSIGNKFWCRSNNCGF